MSGIRVDVMKAQKTAHELIARLAGTYDRLEVAGSVRRGSATVKDVELVGKGLANDPGLLLRRLDSLLGDGVIHLARYGDQMTTRWGEKYRGFLFQQMRFELFMADDDNWGYVLWLRTGPGDANQFVMMKMSEFESPVRAREGYLWHGLRRLTVPHEAEMFRLLGMPYVQPQDRDIGIYRQYLGNPAWAETWTYAADQKPEQLDLFG